MKLVERIKCFVGKIVWGTWVDLPNDNFNISLDAFVVMPDHVHGVVIIRELDIETPHVGSVLNLTLH